jgi:hypothetical protein
MSRDSSVSRKGEKFAAQFREYSAEKRREIDRLGVPPWEKEAEVARIAHQRIVIAYYFNLICREPPISQFFFYPPISVHEWGQGHDPADDEFDDELRWIDFLAALTSGHKIEVADLASNMLKAQEQAYHPPPRLVFESMLNFLSGKIKGRSGLKVPSRALNAVEYSKLLLAELRDMFPKHKYREHKVKANDLKRQAKKIAAAMYGVTVDDLERLIYRETDRRR